MAWTNITFSYGSLLTSTKMTQMDDNFDALASGASGAPSIVEAAIGASAVSQGKLKTTTASGSNASATYSLSGGTYSWWTRSGDLNENTTFGWAGADSAAGVIGNLSNLPTQYIDERYIQASPPYRLGPLFAYLAIRPDGTIAALQVAPDPIWAYHGPTDITPEYYRAGKFYRNVRMVDGVPMALAVKDPATLRRTITGEAVVVVEEREITLAYKDSDMSVIPHPFDSGITGIPGVTIAMLEPGTTMMQRFSDFCDCGEAREVRNLIQGGKLIINNTPLTVPGMPPGVTALRPRWKLT